MPSTSANTCASPHSVRYDCNTDNPDTRPTQRKDSRKLQEVGRIWQDRVWARHKRKSHWVINVRWNRRHEGEEFMFRHNTSELVYLSTFCLNVCEWRLTMRACIGTVPLSKICPTITNKFRRHVVLEAKETQWKHRCGRLSGCCGQCRPP